MSNFIDLLRKGAIVTALIGSAVASPVLSLVPDRWKIHPPENVYIDVVLSGLRSSGAGPLLGAFDITIEYDSAIMTFLPTGSTLGTGLGDPNDPMQTLVGGDNSTAGIFRLLEVSLLEADSTSCVFCFGPFLQDLQGDSMTLARLLFYAPSAVLASSTDFFLPRAKAVLSDSDGREIADFSTTGASIEIPEPPGLMLVGMALLALAAPRCRRLPAATAPPSA